MWNNNNNFGNYENNRPNNNNFYNQTQNGVHFNPLTPPPPPAYIQNMPQYQTQPNHQNHDNNRPRISNQAFISQNNMNQGQNPHQRFSQNQSYRKTEGANYHNKNGFNKGFKTNNGNDANYNNFGNLLFNSPKKNKSRSISRNKADRLSIQPGKSRSRSRNRRKDNLGSHQKKLIWDEKPINLNQGTNYIPHPNNKYPFQPDEYQMNPISKNFPQKNFDAENIHTNLGDSVLVDPNDIMAPKQIESLPKIQQQDSEFFKSNMLNFEFQQKEQRTEGGNNQRGRSRKRVEPRPSNNRYQNRNTKNHQKGQNKQWKNWVIESFIPKPAANGPNKHNHMNRSISFIASSKHYNLLKAELERKGKKFVDPKFPPQFSSIWGFGESKMLKKDSLRRLKWLDSNQIYRGRNYSVFKGGIDPSDIMQGMLGDCYFLSAISAIAERDNRIKKLFLQRNISKTGAYCVALCLNGMWEEVIVDDYFPCRPTSKKPAFNSSKQNEIWVMLLEKAWAKVHGGYLNIDGGLTREALHDLTGAPAITHYTDEQSPNEHWANIIEGCNKKYIMTAGSHDICGNGTDTRDSKTGLCGNHAYSLLAAYELVKSGNGKYRLLRKGDDRRSVGARIVKLRNPWGKGEWRGEWSDRDQRWNSELKKELRHTLKEDGQFYMPFQSFLKYFHDYQICYYHDDFTYSSQRYNSDVHEPTLVNFTIKKPGKYYFSINQINKRFFRKKDSNFKF